MTLTRLIVALVLLTAPAAAQDQGTLEGLEMTSRAVAQGAAEPRHISLVTQTAEDPPRIGGPRVSVRLHGGWRQLLGGDVNGAVANTSRFTVIRLYEYQEDVELQDGDAPALRPGPEYGADVTVHLTPRFGLVGGVGWIERSSAGRLIETPQSTALWPSRTSADLTLVSVPVRFGAQYTYPISRRLSLVVDGGAGLYFTNLQWSQRGEIDFLYPKSTTFESISDVHGYDVGFHGGVSFDVSVSDRMGLVFGVQGVHANIGGLDGIATTHFTGLNVFEFREVEETVEQDGTLRVVELNYTTATPILAFAEDEQTLVDEFGAISVKEASVGLGGLRYTVGLRISF